MTADNKNTQRYGQQYVDPFMIAICVRNRASLKDSIDDVSPTAIM